MEETPDYKHLKSLLVEAMELLEETKARFGLFEQQQYGKLKKKYEQQQALPSSIRTGLNVIATQ